MLQYGSWHFCGSFAVLIISKAAYPHRGIYGVFGHGCFSADVSSQFSNAKTSQISVTALAILMLPLLPVVCTTYRKVEYLSLDFLTFRYSRAYAATQAALKFRSGRAGKILP